MIWLQARNGPSWPLELQCALAVGRWAAREKNGRVWKKGEDPANVFNLEIAKWVRGLYKQVLWNAANFKFSRSLSKHFCSRAETQHLVREAPPVLAVGLLKHLHRAYGWWKSQYLANAGMGTDSFSPNIVANQLNPWNVNVISIQAFKEVGGVSLMNTSVTAGILVFADMLCGQTVPTLLQLRRRTNYTHI